MNKHRYARRVDEILWQSERKQLTHEDAKLLIWEAYCEHIQDWTCDDAVTQSEILREALEEDKV